MQNYTKIKHIGDGAMGSTDLVQRKADGKEMVAKVINMKGLGSQECAAAIQEVTVHQELRHPNIVKLHEAFLEGGMLYIVMEYAAGGDLAELLRKAKGSPMKESRILDMFTEICLAMDHVHSKGIVHRDLKPSNILLTKDGSVRLADFGIAKVLKTKRDLADTMVGTPYYISPEICEDKPYGRKSDIWALGCVLYELVMQKRPFQGQNLPALAIKIIQGKYEDLPDSCNPEIRKMINSMLRKDPAKRPDISALLANPLLQARAAKLSSPPPTAPPATKPPPPAPSRPSKADREAAPSRSQLSSRARPPPSARAPKQPAPPSRGVKPPLSKQASAPAALRAQSLERGERSAAAGVQSAEWQRSMQDLIDSLRGDLHASPAHRRSNALALPWQSPPAPSKSNFAPPPPNKHAPLQAIIGAGRDQPISDPDASPPRLRPKVKWHETPELAKPRSKRPSVSAYPGSLSRATSLPAITDARRTKSGPASDPLPPRQRRPMELAEPSGQAAARNRDALQRHTRPQSLKDLEAANRELRAKVRQAKPTFQVHGPPPGFGGEGEGMRGSALAEAVEARRTELEKGEREQRAMLRGAKPRICLGRGRYPEGFGAVEAADREARGGIAMVV